MASHQLTIANASLVASLLRPDPTTVSREEIEHFHSLLNSLISRCSAANVQKCKQWVFLNVSQSQGRLASLAKYMVALTTSFVGPGRRAIASTDYEPSAKRKRLHLLYLVNDIFHYEKHRLGDRHICEKLQSILPALFGNAAAFVGSPKHQQKILDLLYIWEGEKYYAKEYLEELQVTVSTAQEAGSYDTTLSKNGMNKGSIPTSHAASSLPYVMPVSHGDQSIPWFDLPAGNLMPHIIPNSIRPVNPSNVKPLRLLAGPPDETLVRAVGKLLRDVQTLYGDNTYPVDKASWDIDELGQLTVLDEIAGGVLDGEGYYGWSRVFCEKMKQRKSGGLFTRNDHGSRSPSSSPMRRKRRHSHGSEDSTTARFRSRRRQPNSSSRSPSPPTVESRPKAMVTAFSEDAENRGMRSTSFQPPKYEGHSPQPPLSYVPQAHFTPSLHPNFPNFPPLPFQGTPLAVQSAQYGLWHHPPPPIPVPDSQHNLQFGVWPPPLPPLRISQEQESQYPAQGRSWQVNERQDLDNSGNSGSLRGGRSYRGREL